MPFPARKIAFWALLWTFLSSSPIQAQYIWDGGAGTGSWNTTANWNPDGTPLAGTTTTITLDGTVQTATVQDISDPFLLNQLILGSSATNGFTVTGNALQFGGSGAAISFNGPTGANSNLVINAPIDFGTGSVVIDINANAGISGTYFEMILGGPLSGSGTVTKGGTQPGELVLAGRNSTFTGTFANTLGQTQLAGRNALGRGTTLTISGGSLVLAGVVQSISQGYSAAGASQSLGSLTGAGTFQIGHSTGTAGAAAPATVILGFTGGSPSFGGSITAAVATSQLAKVGTGTQQLTATSTTFLGKLSVRDGTLLLSSSGTLSPSSTSAIVGGTTLLGGALLRLDNSASNNNRLQNNGIITLAGGTLRIDGNNSANTAEVIGGLAIGSGQASILINPGTNAAGSGTQVNVSPNQAITTISQPSLTGTLFVRGANLGAFSSTAPPAATSVAGLVFGNAAPINALLVGGGGSGANTSILPFGLGSSTNSSEPDTFLTYSTHGIRPLNISVGTGDFEDFFAGANTHNIRHGSFTVSTPTIRNSLVETGGTVNLNDNLTLTSGALLITGTSTIQGTGTLALGNSSTAYISTATGADLTLLSPVSAFNFSKSGGGELLIGAAVSLDLNAEVAVNSGTLTLQNGGSVTASNGVLKYQVSKGATLNASLTGGLVLGTGKTLTGNGTVTGSVTIASGATVLPDALSGPGTLSVGSMNWLPGGTYRWTVSSAVTDSGLISPYTASLIHGTGSLDLSSLSLGDPFTIKVVSLGADNAASTAVYDLDTATNPQWTIARFNTGVTGFDASNFAIDSSEFVNGGSFSITQSGNDLTLTYSSTPVPEPTGLLALGACVTLLARRVRKSAV